MSCDITKFVISKGSENTFTFTIKQDNSTLPLVINYGVDTFTATLVNLKDEADPLITDATYPQIVDKPMTYTIEDAAIGRVALVIPLLDTANLVASRGTAADRYYLRPTYKLVLNCVTTNNGNFIAKVAEVYVD